MTPVITAIIGLVSAALSGGLTFVFARRKNRAQAVSMELENAKEVINIWRELSKEQDKRIEELEVRIEELQDAFDKISEKYRDQCVTCKYRMAFIEGEEPQ